jgi:hypothetical protein
MPRAGTTSPTSGARWPWSVSAFPFGRYPSSLTIAAIRAAVAGATYPDRFTARETVAYETPARAAMLFKVGIWRRAA